MDSPTLPPKRDVFLRLLREGSVLLHIDARRPGVMLPPWLLGETHVVLEYGYDLAVPITDLIADNNGVTATLSFRREPHRCVVPWTATFGVTTHEGRGLLWPDEIPPEVRAKLDSATPEGSAPARRPKSVRSASPQRSARPDSGNPTKPPRPTHLKLVK